MSAFSPVRTNRKRVNAPSVDELQRAMSSKRRKTDALSTKRIDENLHQSINQSHILPNNPSNNSPDSLSNRSPDNHLLNQYLINHPLPRSTDSQLPPLSPMTSLLDEPVTPLQMRSSSITQINRTPSISQQPSHLSPSSWSAYPWTLSPGFASPRFTPPRSPLQRRRSNLLLIDRAADRSLGAFPSPITRRSSRSLAATFSSHDLITPHTQTVFSWETPCPSNDPSNNQLVNPSMSSLFSLTAPSPPPRQDSSAALPCSLSPLRAASFGTYLDIDQPGSDLMRSHSNLFPLPKPLTTPRFAPPSLITPRFGQSATPSSSSTRLSAPNSCRKTGSFVIIGTTPSTETSSVRLRPQCVAKLQFVDSAPAAAPATSQSKTHAEGSQPPAELTFIFGPDGLVESTPPSAPRARHLRPFHATQTLHSRFTFPAPATLEGASPFRPHSFTFGDDMPELEPPILLPNHSLLASRVTRTHHRTRPIKPSSQSNTSHSKPPSQSAPPPEPAPTIRFKCKCKKSKCLKLYCECFAHGVVCGPECACEGCHNTDDPKHETEIEKARQITLDRDPKAFYRGDNVKSSSSADTSPKEEVVLRGCHCKKSKCLKKYCECLNAGVKCTSKCKCSNCENGKPHSHDDDARITSKL